MQSFDPVVNALVWLNDAPTSSLALFDELITQRLLAAARDCLHPGAEFMNEPVRIK